jgi:hypothetical protein
MTEDLSSICREIGENYLHSVDAPASPARPGEDQRIPAARHQLVEMLAKTKPGSTDGSATVI